MEGKDREVEVGLLGEVALNPEPTRGVPEGTQGSEQQGTSSIESGEAGATDGDTDDGDDGRGHR